ncbi:TniB family NTP-binding protein [Pararhodobacter oceanensis]|uniref:Transposase n=1 Tax=Pararhodobacter oceanensis TaxID=2172121 RepID=A0A2T8HPC8_9RHOB|nr:TniB family NTP-binding protein [Pararhodobacter oceanensis]PVH27301.1 transposase [Pararhodobacter oceanensis]
MIGDTDNLRVLEDLNKLHINTPRDAEFASHLNRLLRRDENGEILAEARKFTRTGETRGIMVIDGAGGGKSTLISHALETHPALAKGADGMPKYISSLVPSPATFKSMTEELLDKSGYPEVSRRREAWGMWKIFRSRLESFGTTVLWIDEAHDLFCADRNLILRAVKTLMQGDGAVIVILSGTEMLAEIVRSDPQVQRRFSTLYLPPVSVQTDGEQFRGVIDAYCAKAGLVPPVESELVDRLFHASRYRFGRCVENIMNAIERALIDEDEQLDIDHFAQGWAMQEGCVLGANVFLAKEWWMIDLDRHEDEEQPTRRRKKKRV